MGVLTGRVIFVGERRMWHETTARRVWQIMASYWGLRAISDRLEYAYERSPIRQAIATGLPIYKRRRGRHLQWYIDDNLITVWQLQRAKMDRQKLLERANSKDNTTDATSRSKP